MVASQGDEREETACAESAAAIAKQAGARHLVLTGAPCAVLGHTVENNLSSNPVTQKGQ